MRLSTRRSLRPTRISFFAFQDIITSITGVLILVTLILALHLNPVPLVTRALADGPSRLAALRADLQAAQAESAALQTSLAAAAGAPSKPRVEQDIANLDLQWRSASNRLAETRRDQMTVAQERAGLGLESLNERIRRLTREAAEHARENEAATRAIETLETELSGLQAQLRESGTKTSRLFVLPDESGATQRALLVVVSSHGLRCERYAQPDRREDVPFSNAESRWKEILEAGNPGDEQVLFFVRPSGIELFRRCSDLARDARYRVGYEALEENRLIDFGNSP